MNIQLNKTKQAGAISILEFVALVVAMATFVLAAAALIVGTDNGPGGASTGLYNEMYDLVSDIENISI